MSDNSNPSSNKVLVIPDAEQIQRDAALFGTTRQYIEWAGAVATGQQEGSSDDVVNALTVVHANIAALEERHLIASAAVAGLKEMAEKLTEQRDQVIQEKAQIEADMEDALSEARDEGWEAAMEHAAEEMYYDMGYDLDEAWDALKGDMEGWASILSNDLSLLGETDAAKQLHDMVQTFIRTYDGANEVIQQYQRYTAERRDEISKKRSEQRHAFAEQWAAEQSYADPDEDTDEEDEDADD